LPESEGQEEGSLEVIKTYQPKEGLPNGVEALKELHLRPRPGCHAS